MLIKLLIFLTAWFLVGVIVAMSAVRLLVEPLAPGIDNAAEAAEHEIERQDGEARLPA